MTSLDVIVIIGGLLIGYLVVHTLMSGKSSSSSGDQGPTGQESNGSSRAWHAFGKGHDGNHSHACDDLSATWFVSLGVSEQAPMDVITQAYKQLIRQYHPDKVATLGTELRDLAAVRSKEINAAYTYACKLKSRVN